MDFRGIDFRIVLGLSSASGYRREFFSLFLVFDPSVSSWIPSKREGAFWGIEECQRCQRTEKKTDIGETPDLEARYVGGGIIFHPMG